MPNQPHPSAPLAIRMHPADNVAVVMSALAAGDSLRVVTEQGDACDRVDLATDLPLPYHKVALVDLPAGAEVLKYGEVIGRTTAPIARGAWVHLHNLASAVYWADEPNDADEAGERHA